MSYPAWPRHLPKGELTWEWLNQIMVPKIKATLQWLERHEPFLTAKRGRPWEDCQ